MSDKYYAYIERRLHPAFYTLPNSFAPHRIPRTLHFPTLPASHTLHCISRVAGDVYQLSVPVIKRSDAGG